MSEEVKDTGTPGATPGNGKPALEKEPYPQEPEKDFKVAEIWIRDGRIQLDATDEFWADRIRAVGLLSFCMDIVKTAKSPETSKPKIVTGKGLAPLDFIRNRIKGKRK